MRGFESPVGIETRIVENELKIAVTEGPAGRIEIELCDSDGRSFGWFAVGFGVEFEDVVPVLEFRCLELDQNVLVGETAEILVAILHCHSVSPGKSVLRTSIKRAE